MGIHSVHSGTTLELNLTVLSHLVACISVPTTFHIGLKGMKVLRLNVSWLHYFSWKDWSSDKCLIQRAVTEMQINPLPQISTGGAPGAGASWSSSQFPCIGRAFGPPALCCVEWEHGAGWGEAHQHAAHQTLRRDSPPHRIRLGECCVLGYITPRGA